MMNIAHCGSHGPMTASNTRLGEAEEAARPHREHRRHDEVDDEELELRHVVDGERAHDADDRRAERGARQRAEAADHHHGEGEHDHIDAETGDHGHRGRREGAGERREQRAERERREVVAADVHAHRAAHFGVVDHRKEKLAGARAMEQPRQAATEDERRGHEQQVVGRIRHAGGLEAAEKRVRLGDEVGVHAPDQLDHVLEDQEQRVGREQDHYLVLRIHEAQDHALDRDREGRRYDDRRDDQHHVREHGREAAREPRCSERGRRVRADGGEAAVGDVDDLHHAVDQRQAQRGNENPRRVDDPVDRDREKLVQMKSGTDPIFPPGEKTGTVPIFIGP
jgi:hypothetical protein